MSILSEYQPQWPSGEPEPFFFSDRSDQPLPLIRLEIFKSPSSAYRRFPSVIFKDPVPSISITVPAGFHLLGCDVHLFDTAESTTFAVSESHPPFLRFGPSDEYRWVAAFSAFQSAPTTFPEAVSADRKSVSIPLNLPAMRKSGQAKGRGVLLAFVVRLGNAKVAPFEVAGLSPRMNCFAQSRHVRQPKGASRAVHAFYGAHIVGSLSRPPPPVDVPRRCEDVTASRKALKRHRDPVADEYHSAAPKALRRVSVDAAPNASLVPEPPSDMDVADAVMSFSLSTWSSGCDETFGGGDTDQADRTVSLDDLTASSDGSCPSSGAFGGFCHEGDVPQPFCSREWQGRSTSLQDALLVTDLIQRRCS